MIRILFLILLLPKIAQCQSGVVDSWQGLLIPSGKNVSEGTPYLIDIAFSGGKYSFKSRNESFMQEYYTVRLAKGKVDGNSILIEEYQITKRKIDPKSSVCKLNFDLTLNETSGYLEGTYKSSDCRNILGKVIFYRSESNFPDNESIQTSHNWVEVLREDLKLNRKAPDIRNAERANFKFQPIYFDYDKDEIKPEYEAFLNEMIRVVSSHSDLRVLVIGNTDSDGSDEYNDDLSKRRATAIINYFKAHGLTENHLEFKYNGEKNPVDTNETNEGKQKNRRVEFRFI